MTSPSLSADTTTPVRLASIDALRGMAILAIIGFDGAVASLSELAQSGPELFRDVCGFLAVQFSHVAWEGLHLYDFVFPMFIFITGAGVAFALPRALKRQGRGAVYAKALRRSAILYVLGLIYYGGVGQGWDEIRYVGVLQRIAVCYLATSILFMHLRAGGLALVCAAILAGYWAVMSFVEAPGVPAGSWAPNDNLAAWIDRTYLPGRLWYGESDPEGLLSTAPAIATCLLGALAGMTMQSRLEPSRIAAALIACGALLVVAGLVLALWLPIVKSLWTPSYALVTGGASAMLLGATYWLMDVRRAFAASWLVWVGANAITLYMLAGFGLFDIVASSIVGGVVGATIDAAMAPGASAFLAHMIGLALAIALASFLYRKRIFVRI
jgi:predicted acyltransferase